jgi:hypothetical protein
MTKNYIHPSSISKYIYTHAELKIRSFIMLLEASDVVEGQKRSMSVLVIE